MLLLQGEIYNMRIKTTLLIFSMAGLFLTSPLTTVSAQYALIGYLVKELTGLFMKQKKIVVNMK